MYPENSLSDETFTFTLLASRPKSVRNSESMFTSISFKAGS